MALRNRTLDEQQKLQGADRSKDATKFKLGQFRTLENWVPAHVYSIKKKRGVELLDSEANTPVPPNPCESACIDTTIRGQAAVVIEDRFVQSNSFPPNSNLRTSWGFVSAGEEVHTTIVEASCDGGNAGYQSTCVQRNHFVGPGSLDHPALIDPDPFLPFFGQGVGTSDVPIYGVPSNAGWEIYYPLTSTHLQYPLAAGPRGLIITTGENTFCQQGDKIYFPCHATIAPFEKHIVSFTVAGQVQTDDFDFGIVFNVSHIAATPNHLYVLGNPASDANLNQIYKIDRTSLAVIDIFMLDNIFPFAMGVVNDNLIYVLTAGSPAAFYYIENFSSLTYVGNTVGQGFTPFGNVTGMFVNGALYYGSNGFSGFTPDIFKTTIACPTTPIIASASTGAGSVVAGASITVNWSDVLLPVANDHFWLLAAPTPPNLGIIFPPVVSRITDGSGTGSMSFLIPGGTPAGSYILAFMANDLIYVCKTDPFTVT